MFASVALLVVFAMPPWTAVKLAAMPEAAAASQAAPASPKQMIEESVLIPVIVKVNLYTKKANVGDVVTFEANGEVRSSEGALLLPKRAILTGAITLVEPKDKETKRSRMAIRVTKAEWKDGSIEMVAVFGGQVLVPVGSSQMIAGGPNPHAATPLDSANLEPMDGVDVERDDKLGTVLIGVKRELDIPKGAAMILTTIPQ